MIYLAVTNEMCDCIKYLAEKVDGFQYLTQDTEVKDTDTVVVVKSWGFISMLNLQKNHIKEAAENISCDELIYGAYNDPVAMTLLNKYPNAVYLLLNSWEVTWMHATGSERLDQLIDYVGIKNKVIFSSCDIMNDPVCTSKYDLWPMDWVILREKYKPRVHERKTPSKRFVCLNRKSMIDRAIFMLLCQKNFPEKFNYTYVIPNLPPWDNILQIMTELDEPYTYEDYTQICSRLPIELDGNFNTCSWKGDGDKVIDFIHDANIFVIFETDFNPTYAVQQVSEKLYQGIRHKMPFLVFGRWGGILKHLRELGFTTFSPWINEQYDNRTLNWSCRLKMLFTEIKRLATMPDDEFNVLMVELNKIADKNAEKLLEIGGVVEERVKEMLRGQ